MIAANTSYISWTLIFRPPFCRPRLHFAHGCPRALAVQTLILAFFTWVAVKAFRDTPGLGALEGRRGPTAGFGIMVLAAGSCSRRMVRRGELVRVGVAAAVPRFNAMRDANAGQAVERVSRFLGGGDLPRAVFQHPDLPRACWLGVRISWVGQAPAKDKKASNQGHHAGKCRRSSRRGGYFDLGPVGTRTGSAGSGCQGRPLCPYRQPFRLRLFPTRPEKCSSLLAGGTRGDRISSNASEGLRPPFHDTNLIDKRA